MGLFPETRNNLKKKSFLTAANKQLSGASSINRSVIKNALRQNFASKEGRRCLLKGWSGDLNENSLRFCLRNENCNNASNV